MSGFWAGGIPGWGLVVGGCLCVLFLLLGLWFGMGRRERAYEDGYDDGQAEERERARPQLARRQARRGERTAAFLNPPEVHHEARGAFDLSGLPDYVAGSDAWFARHRQQEAGDDPTVSAWTQQMAESMDAWLQEHVYGVPVPYLPGEDRP
jgi:hypothetical protein